MREQPAPDPGMVEHGRQYIWIATIYLAATSVVVAALWTYRFGFDRGHLSRVAIRLSVLALLGAFMLQGRGWARWTVVALILFGLYLIFPSFLRHNAWGRGEWPATAFLVAMYTGHAIIARGLIYSRSVRAYFAAHRRPRPTAHP